ncbi:helicase conserved C-terminal domain protein [Mycobacteroides abscessus MAB_030201_1075]|uniref:Helicase conserved C-terminal domain protein n=2 Tax=Mycobacteroides abscessus TaxID=36809 RepID=A0A829PFI6_9MYCO|nr:helicase conserved C-terminal domain protein [Mycobacteroides abscessus MAB_110811_1470]ETZ87519.1 helicase conserved C-terminal domain protein [Mycobacteroides abscessus MAB_030201_1075]ETZ94808.1 helicase conserved C-terminal domain protein [Mycobacteroides abscessus MAB_030201_1061]
MANLADQYGFRDGIVDELIKDLVGPAEGLAEVTTDLPLDRYIAGVLWPADDLLQEAAEPESGEVEENGSDDSQISQALMRYPTSMGITFSVDLTKASSVQIAIEAARYVPSGTTGSGQAVDAQRPSERMRRSKPDSWTREPQIVDPIDVDVVTPGAKKVDVVPGLQLYVYARVPKHGRVAVSVVLRNTQVPRKGELRDGFSWFQVGVEVRSPEQAIVDRSSYGVLSEDSDLRSAALLYRHARVFAIGHGCAATWEREGVNSHVGWVKSTFVPRQEISRAKPGGVSDDIDLRMSFLSTATDEELAANLGQLVTEYCEWIDRLSASVENGEADVEAGLKVVADEHVRHARNAAERMQNGIDLVVADPDAGRAFRLANAAMQLQRARQDWVRSGAVGAVGDGAEQSWRPFQIAYILLNLPGLANADHKDRDIADLLWFPTGGGKTEAYLGLVAFTIFHRRLKDSETLGVAVIMRYTLRLLTIQQFERATMLLCSLERLRHREKDLGRRPFSIGLWVGQAATPNTLIEARKSLNAIAEGRELNERNPVQLTQCPWCGQDLNETHYSVVKSPVERLRIACGNGTCDFRDGLPAYVVDEDIYQVRPELVLGTVDKFAQMAWREDVRKLFARDGIGTPPSLIIQDELHLISGPLGSIVGLYEAAIDAACGQLTSHCAIRGRPKVIASTATIRRADRQILAVFNRRAEQFPPPGIDPDQSFFAEPASRDRYGTREYIGVMAPGASHATLMVRIYAAILQAVHDLTGSSATRDPYWTLLGYFNSLRVLGSADLQVQDDVRDRLQLVARRKQASPRDVRPSVELTSRVPSADIPRRLKSLEKDVSTGSANDVVLATNMISVGLDIDRLGLMAVMGQPQSSAEYIQATSRVGRKHPGLVVTIFNSARSRDRSHYENFVPYHQALYRAVEATSATPFAARARDRALHGVLVSLTRLLVDDLAGNETAHKATDRYDEIALMAELLGQRAQAVTDPEEADDTVNQLGELLKVWAEAAESRPDMQYKNSRDYDDSLLVPSDVALTDDDIEYSTLEAPWPTLQSMRDVDAESALYQIPARKVPR